jgi:hypothetical protein
MEHPVDTRPPSLHWDDCQRGQHGLHSCHLVGCHEEVDVTCRSRKGGLAPEQAPGDAGIVEGGENLSQQWMNCRHGASLSMIVPGLSHRFPPGTGVTPGIEYRPIEGTA